MRAARQRLAEIDDRLAGSEAVATTAEITTREQAKAAMRAKLQHLLLVVENSGASQSCRKRRHVLSVFSICCAGNATQAASGMFVSLG